MSVVSSKLDAKRVETVSPAGSAESSLMAASEADPDARGASLTSVIEVSSSTVEEEKTVVPPFVEASTVSPLLGAVEESSTSRVVRAPGVPLKSEAGRKRSLVVLARKRALVSSRPEVAMVVQEEDPSACHCQVP